MPEHPKASPRPEHPPELEAETPSGIHRAFKRDLNWQGAKLTVAMAVVATGTAFGAYRAILGEAAAQTDAGLKGHEDRIVTLEQQRKTDREEVGNRLDRVEKNQNADHELTLGTSQKMDKLLEHWNLRNPSPAPAPHKDGGQ